MLLNEIIEEQHVLHKWRHPKSTRYFGSDLFWAVEVERNHTDRLLSLYGGVLDQSISFAPVRESTIGEAKFTCERLRCGASSKNSSTAKHLGFSSLIFSNVNMIAERKLPPEAFRSVHRMFFIPRCLLDPVGIVNHPDFLSIFMSSSFLNGVSENEIKISPSMSCKSDRDLECNSRVILKIQASPKNLEKSLMEMIRTNLDGKYLLRLDFDNYQDFSFNKSNGTAESECRNNNAAVGEIAVNENDINGDICIRRKVNDSTDHGNQNSKSNQKVGNTHTHLLQCVYGVDDGVFRWGIVSKADSVRYRLTAESINIEIERERKTRFVRDDYLRFQNIPDNENILPKRGINTMKSTDNFDLTQAQNSDQNVVLTNYLCSGTENDSNSSCSEDEKNIKSYAHPSKPASKPQTSSDIISCPEEKIDEKEGKYDSQKTGDISRTENDDFAAFTKTTIEPTKSLITNTEFSPASRAYYKMSEVKEFYFPLWGWSWPRGQFEYGLKDEDCSLPAPVCAQDVLHGLTTEMTSIARVDPDPDSDPNRDHNPDRGGERDGVLGCGYGCCAVDVGSSPGGWTQCLAAHCSSVISIDSGLLRDDVLRLENVQYVQGLIQSTAAQAALRNVRNWRDECREAKSYGELEKNGERVGGRDREIEIEKYSNEEDVGHLGKSDIRDISENQVFENTNQNKNRIYSGNDATDGTVIYGRNDEGGRGRRVSDGGLRVAVCDVNLGASAAASLLRDFVLPHMVSACECICDRRKVEKLSNAPERKEKKMQLAGCHNLDGNDELRGPGGDEDCCTGDSTVGATDCTTKCSISDTTSNQSNISSSKIERECLCGGYVVLTLKLPKGAKNVQAQSAADSARAVLTRPGCWDFKIVHLNANSSNERTLLCRFGGKRENKVGSKI